MKKERTPRNGERYDSLGVKKEKDSKEWRRKKLLGTEKERSIRDEEGMNS